MKKLEQHLSEPVMGSCLVTPKGATGPAARPPRTQLRDAEFGSGKLTAPLRLTWADGSRWELDVPRAESRKARTLLDQLAAAA